MKNKDKKFIKDFIKLYINYRVAEFNLFREEKNSKIKIKKLGKKVDFSLSKYKVLFEDMNFLERSFVKINKKQGVGFLSRDFRYFLRWIINRLYKKKIISRNLFKKLSKELEESNIRFINLGPLAGKHV